MRRRAVILAVGGALAGAAGLGSAWLSGAGSDEAVSVAQGRKLYATNCASCHGDELEGQPDWKSPLPSGRMPAPPHDDSGHTWHHPDGVLFRIVKEGPAAVVRSSYQSDMPGFGEVLGDDDIRAVLAFIKSTWPDRQREYQAELSRREKEEAR